MSMHTVEDFHDEQIMDGSCMKKALALARSTINSLYHENKETCGLTSEDMDTLHHAIEVIEKISHMSNMEKK